MADDTKRLQETLQRSYALRSVFFHRKLRQGQFRELLKFLAKLDPDEYDWSLKSKIGISPAAFDRAAARRLNLCLTFCHPAVILEAPKTIAYYRCVASISQKGIHKLAFDVKRYETGVAGMLSDEKAFILAWTLNQLISAIVESDASFSREDLPPLYYAGAGAQIDGSWRNEVGADASHQVKEMICDYFVRQRLVKHLLLPKAKTAQPSQWKRLKTFEALVLKNGCTIRFGNEPDVGFYSADGTLIGMIEIKGGVDSAGALERYGAAKKTFDEALNQNKSAFTMYLARCITPAVEERIRQDRSVRKTSNLIDVLLSPPDRDAFLKEVRWWVRL